MGTHPFSLLRCRLNPDHPIMSFDIDLLHQSILARAGVGETARRGKRSVEFAVDDRPFAILTHDSVPYHLTLLCSAPQISVICDLFTGVEPALYMNRRQWITIDLSLVCDSDRSRDAAGEQSSEPGAGAREIEIPLEALIDQAYALALSLTSTEDPSSCLSTTNLR